MTPLTVHGPQLNLALGTALTDEDGRFVLRGIGRERVAKLLVSGPGIETVFVYARTRPGKRIELAMQHGSPGARNIVYHTANFTHVAGPSKPITGVVTNSESGQPIAGVLLKSDIIATIPNWIGRDHIRTVTNELGRFRMEGFPIGKDNRIVVIPPVGSRYLPSAFEANTNTPNAVIPHDVALQKGVRVRGQVTDARTGKPLSGEIQYYALDKQAKAMFPGFRSTSRAAKTRSGVDGRYEIVVLPARGVITFNAQDHMRYKRGIGADKIKGSSSMGWISGNHHLLVEVNPTADESEMELNLELPSGIDLAGNVLDPEGRPVTDYFKSDGSNIGGWRPVKDAKFTAQSYYPGDRYRILIYEPKRNLIARYNVQGESPGEITIKLQPAGSLKGRLIDKDGAPIDGVLLHAVQTSRMNKTDRVTIPPKSPGRMQHTDADGRFHLKGFLPGVKYTISAIGTRKLNGEEFPAELGQIPFGKALKAGQTVELGDVKFK